MMHSMQHPEPINSEVKASPVIAPVEPPLNVREGIEYQMALEQSLANPDELLANAIASEESDGCDPTDIQRILFASR